MRIAYGNFVVLSEADKVALGTEPDTTILQGTHCQLPDSSLAPAYRIATVPKFSTSTNSTRELVCGQAIIWAQKSPTTGNHDVGEIGDIWIAVPEDPSEEVTIWIKYSTMWDVATSSLVAKGQKATISHPRVPQRRLAWANGFLVWTSPSTARQHRSKMHAHGIECDNSTFLRVLYEALVASLSTRSPAEDPSILAVFPSVSGPPRSDATINNIPKLAEALQRYRKRYDHQPSADTVSAHELEIDRHLLPRPGSLEYHPRMDICVWWGSVATVLPFAVDKQDGVETPDLVWTKWAAQVSKNATQSPAPGVEPPVLVIEHPDHIPQGTARADMLRTIRETLAQGRCICVKHVQDVHGWTWSKETFQALLGSPSLDKKVQWIEAGLRRDRLREDDDFPQAVKPSMYEHDTVLKFLARADEPGVAINMMDIPLYAVARPWFIDEISDDVLALRATNDVNPNALFPIDVSRTHAWALATTGGFWTDPHHDANGAATWVTVSTGAKIWVLLTPKSNDPDRVMEALGFAATIPQQESPANLERYFHVSSILLEPGSILIQPPGQFHAVYTPMKTIIHGGHVLLYNTLHQTLLTRRVEYLSNHCGTNASHPAIDRMLARMVVALAWHSGTDFPVLHMRCLVELLLQGGQQLYTVHPQDDSSKKRKKTEKQLLEDRDALFDHNAAFLVLANLCANPEFAKQAPPSLPWQLPLDTTKLQLLKVEVPIDKDISSVTQKHRIARDQNARQLMGYLDKFEPLFQRWDEAT